MRVDAQAGRVSHPAVDNFESATVTLLQHMLMSESPVIPWTGLKKFDPVYVEVDPSHLHRQKQAAMSEEAFRDIKVVGFKRPILLSCNHQKVKIDKGKVRLEVPWK